MLTIDLFSSYGFWLVLGIKGKQGEAALNRMLVLLRQVNRLYDIFDAAALKGKTEIYI